MLLLERIASEMFRLRRCKPSTQYPVASTQRQLQRWKISSQFPVLSQNLQPRETQGSAGESHGGLNQYQYPEKTESNFCRLRVPKII